MNNDRSKDQDRDITPQDRNGMKRRDLLLSGSSLLAASALAGFTNPAQAQQPRPAPAAPTGKRPNILVIFGDDVGQSNISAYTHGPMGYKTPNIDRIAREGMMFTAPPSSPASCRYALVSPRSAKPAGRTQEDDSERTLPAFTEETSATASKETYNEHSK